MIDDVWSLEALKNSLDANRELIEDEELGVTFVDLQGRVALGVGFAGKVVFVGSQSRDVKGFSSERVSLVGDKVFVSPSLHLERAFRLEFSGANDDEIECVFAIVAGLRQLAIENSGDLPIDALKDFLVGATASFDLRLELGLFGELVTIFAAQDTAIALKCWHRDSNSTYDFSSSIGHLEVKTTLAARRRHWFSFGQLSKMANDHLTVLSISTTLVPDGVACHELVERILELSDEEDRASFTKKLEDYDLGEMRRTFDLHGAITSIKAYGAGQLSSSGVLPPNVLDAKFYLDLGAFKEYSAEKLANLEPFGLLTAN